MVGLAKVAFNFCVGCSGPSVPSAQETGAETKKVSSAPYKRAFTLERKDNSKPLGVAGER